MHVLQRSTLPWVAIAFGAALIGAAGDVSFQIAFVLLLAILAVAALNAPASVWVLAALVTALTSKGLVQLHALPSVATFIDLFLSWGALAVGLMRMGPGSPFRRRHFRWLAFLALAMAISWAFNPSEVLRPLLYMALLGEPFAIVGALLADPPSPRMRRVLELSLLALVLVQIPICALQLVRLGPADHIQGTLYGAGAGAHVMSAVIIVGAIWILSGERHLRGSGIWRVAILAVLVFIPFVADAKQVIAATVSVFLVLSWRGGRLATLLRVTLVLAMVVGLFTLDPAGSTGLRYIGNVTGGQGGKEAAASFLWHKLDGDPASLVFGKGPAETVSRAAFETTRNYQLEGSPLAALGLKPATIAAEAEAAAAASSTTVTTSTTSIATAVSSMLGVFGDLGLLGLVAYGGLFLSLLLHLRKETSPEGIAAACGFSMFLALGLVFDWWEQPPFGVFLGALAGLSLTAVADSDPKDDRLEKVSGAKPQLLPRRPRRIALNSSVSEAATER